MGRPKTAEREMVTCQTCGKQWEERVSKHRRFCSKKCDGQAQSQRQYKQVTCVCEVCGKTYTVNPYRVTKGTRFCSRACANPVIARETAMARGDAQRGTGKRTKYVKFRNRHLHRHVAELKLGRALLPGEVVHHIDGNSLNNHPDNIVVTTQAIHARGHSTKGRICSIPGCGRKHAAKGYCGKHWKQSRRL